MRSPKLLLLVVLVLAAGAFFAFGGHRYLTFESMKAQQAAIQSYYEGHPWQTATAFFVIYVAVTGLSLPGAATILTLGAGALFGLVWGTVIVSFASSCGATLACLLRASCSATGCSRNSASTCARSMKA
jgi:uncharacterized membrane protein YdjX (TVP38/TMEM64 family)